MMDRLEGARALAQTAGVRRTSDEVLRVHGADARAWLNGQITNDVSTSSRGDAVYALVANLRGRVMSDLFALDRGQDFLVLLPAGRRAPIASYLDGFLIMEDVELEPAPELVVLTAQGPRAGTVAPDGWPCSRLGGEGRDVVVELAGAEARLSALAAAAEEVGGGEVDEEAWELARARAAVPRYGVDFGEATLPQEVGLAARAVSFGKGCYQGQEAIYMLEKRGKPPKRLVRLDVTGRIPAVPAPLHDEAGAEVGALSTLVEDPDRPGIALGLGLVRRAAAAAGTTLRVGDGAATVRGAI